jgi:hypothetical protein
LSNSLRLDLLHRGPEKQINIFIPGFRALRNQEAYLRVCSRILASKPPGLVYLYNWQSTGRRLPPIASVIRLIAKRGRVTPLSVLLFAAETTASKIYQFKTAERATANAGRMLLRHLCRIPDSRKLKINLIGHSLGTLVIQHSLLYSDWSKYKIQDCLLLGGAAYVGSDWEGTISNIRGRLINAYSENDGILKIAPDNHSRVGRVPILLRSKQIENRHYRSFGHFDYLEKLPYVLPRLSRKLKPSKSYL